MSSWDAISNFMVERQENRDMGQFDHVRMGAQGFVYPEQQPLELSEDQPDDFGIRGIITGGGGLDEQLDTRQSATAVEPTMRDDLRVGTEDFLQEQFGMDQFQARRFSEQLIGSAGELSATALGIGVADLLPLTAAPLTMQEGAQLFSEGMETGSGTDMAVGGVITAFGALEALPVFGAGFKMMNKAAQSEILREFIGTAADAFTRTGEITQDILIEAGEAAQARLDSMMSGTTLSANPVGAAGDALVAGAGKVAEAIKPVEPAPVFYSAVANAVDALPMEKGNASQMRAMIAKSAEVKPEEMAWIGLDDFLKGKKSVSKQEIKDFVDANQVRIEEVIKGTAPDKGETSRAFQLQNQTGTDLVRAAVRSGYPELEATGLPIQIQQGAILARELPEELQPFAFRHFSAHDEYAEMKAGRETTTKFSDYTLPGGENYREVLLRLPEQPVSGARYAIQLDYNTRRPSNATTREEAIAEAGGDASRVIEIRGNETVNPNFTGGHYDEPNVLAHMRLNDRTGPDGEKILFVEEIQSDWHQKGRKQGYLTKNDAEVKSLIAEKDAIVNRGTINPADGSLTIQLQDLDRYNELVSQIEPRLPVSYAGVPGAPLKKTWHEMSFRRIARMAAEEGYDAIAWTPGKLQAERYDLSKRISEISYDPDTKKLFAYEKDGYSPVISEVVSEDKLADYIGKESTERLLATTRKTIPTDKGDTSQHILKGADLEIGGEGMKGFYDKMLKGYASKWGKKFGAKVKKIGVSAALPAPADRVAMKLAESRGLVWDSLPSEQRLKLTDEAIFLPDSELDALGVDARPDKISGGELVWTLPVTKKMRDSVLGKGVATFGAAGVAAGLNNEARPNGD